MITPAAPGHMATITSVGPRQLVSSLGSSRRLKAFMLDGHTQDAIAHELQIPKRTISDVLARRWRTIAAPTAAAITDLAARWAGRPGGSTRAADYAAGAGWHSLAWWNDPDTDPEDDPSAPFVIDELAVECCCEGVIDYRKLHPAEQREALRRLAASDKSAPAIATRLKVSVRTVERARERLTAEREADVAEPIVLPTARAGVEQLALFATAGEALAA